MPIRIKSIDHSWQEPVATERVAFNTFSKLESESRGEEAPGDWLYVAFPWANLIDSLQSGSVLASELLTELRSLVLDLSEDRASKFTVCQHIRAPLLENVFEALGIKVVFWPHQTTSGPQGRTLYLPFPLFPAQTVSGVEPFNSTIHEPITTGRRELKASFIGAYNPHIYLSSVRQGLFDLEGKFPEVRIVKRAAWHFDRMVYQRQMKGRRSTYSERLAESANREEYLDTMLRSEFTFCPTGSGPNSIRLFESISLGSIPVLMTSELGLPRASDRTAELWERACVFCDDDPDAIDGVLSSIMSMDDDAVQRKQLAVSELAKEVLPFSWPRIIKYGLANCEIRPSVA